MTIQAEANNNVTLTPPREDKHRRVTPHQRNKSKVSYADAAMTSVKTKDAAAAAISTEGNSAAVSTESRHPVAVSTAKKPNNKRTHHQQHQHGSETSSLNASNAKRQNVNPTPSKFKRNVTSNGGTTNSNSDTKEGLLDASKPEELKKIQQRIRMLQKGKNTAGYARYRSLVPLSQRKSKSLQYPTTPNPYVQMSSRRWQGLVKSWRKALHAYDPPELVQSLQQPPKIDAKGDDDDEEMPKDASSVTQPSPSKDVMECQTPEPPKRKAASRQKDFTPMETSPDAVVSIRDSDRADDDVSPCMSVVSSTATPKAEKMNKHQKLASSGARRELDKTFGEAAESPASGIAKLNRFDEEEITFSSAAKKGKPTEEKKLSTPTKKEPATSKDKPMDCKKAPAAKRPLLRTGAKGWGDDSSDDDDDLL